VRAIAKIAFVCTFASLIGASISSQSASSPSPAQQPLRRMNVSGVENIAGQPFSADLEIEHTQTLLDGSHIHTMQHQKFYRDGDGRIRTEMYSQQGLDQQSPEELTSVTITDAGANVRYSLQPRTHMAQRSTIFSPPVQTQPAPRPIPAPAQQTELQGRTTSEDLGTQTIDGISAEGHRYSTTWPVNSQGNDAPLVNASESWTSAELGLVMVQKLSDPRSGETVRRFTNIQRAEPDPSLFQLPTDYTLKSSQ